MRMLVTGAAGFIGFHTARALLERGDEVLGLDNLNAYYDPKLKAARLALLQRHPNFRFERADLADREAMSRVFARERFGRVVHLAAQAGVRHSIDHPHTYVESNVTGFLHVLEGCRAAGVEHLVYASTSSVYGANTRLPFTEAQNVDHPLSLYAATKKANELMAHSYSALHGLPTTGLRFFTVYGPWGRPDMALFLFTKNILAGRPIEVFNEGRHQRDFTYVDDIVQGRRRRGRPHRAPRSRIGIPPSPTPRPAARPTASTTSAINGRCRCCAISRCWSGASAARPRWRLLPMQPGDVPETSADIELIAHDLGYRPSTSLEVGVRRFVEWYLEHYQSKAA